MIPRRMAIPRALVSYTQLVRHYNVYPSHSFNIHKTISILKAKERREENRHTNTVPNTDKIFEKAYRTGKSQFKLGKRILKAREFLGKDFNLNDELISLSLYPSRSTRVELSAGKPEEKTRCETHNFVVVGERLIQLRKTLLLLHLRSEPSSTKINNLNFERLEEPIMDILMSKHINKKFIKSTCLPDIIVGPVKANMEQKRELALRSLYMIIGFLSFSKGEKFATRFIDNKILKSEGGMLALAVSAANK